MNRDEMGRLFQSYVNGWKKSDKQLILSTCDASCEIVECYGSVYKGTKQIETWIDAWINRKYRVKQWAIINQYVDTVSLTAVFEWSFKCYSENKDHHFNGCSIVQYNRRSIQCIREYRMEAVHYYPYQ
ncbi:hypothetical protein NIE88_01080 [Sporolactobacillus shoreicorticis]|uniref:SnoaL-like domain-containing protein n=1 Tax=Sporolactobacillus shoreicorticis TaxID=1923877 RepID=A0ABW5S3Z6_9BACL|nr:hypothetical protein [Sporolactobacillus shoreicorticis]MCO7124375.1 hypothetical protein [Sporolactobacillus shoreicorticis]